MIDYHCHTTCSDGTLKPLELLALAKSHGVTQLSITDHDTVAAYGEIKLSDIPEGLDLIPGIEFSCLWSNRTIHVIGLDLNLSSEVLHNGIAIQKQHRMNRAKRIAAKLEKMGIAGALEGARSFATDDNLGRPHFARFLVENGHVQSYEAAFKQYLGDNKAAFVKQEWPHIEEVVGWILTAGGIPILAHPDHYKMTRSKLCKLAAHFKSYGGVGMEVLTGRQRPEVAPKLIRIAKESGLIASIGSDFHSPSQAWLRLGMHEPPKDIEGVWTFFE